MADSRSVMTPTLIDEVRDTMEADRCIEIAHLALMLDYKVATNHRLLHEDLKMVKKRPELAIDNSRFNALVHTGSPNA